MYKKTRAKEAIAASLLELCQKKSFQKITIKMIMDNCGFSRKSFYNNFESKYALVIYIFISNTEAIIEEYAEKESWGVVLGRIYRFMYDNSMLFGLRWIADDLQDLVSAIVEYVEDYYYNVSLRLHGKDNITDNFVFLNKYNSYGATNMVIECIRGNLDISPEELGQRLSDALPSEIRRQIDRYNDNCVD